MHPIHSADEIRAAEQSWFASHPGGDLMGRAARAVAQIALSLTDADAPILIAVGPGNNGGDGLFAGEILARAGRPVSIWLTADTGHEAGLQAALDSGAELVVNPMSALVDAALVIDAVLGIGGRPGLPDSVAQFASACEDIRVPVLAVDLPSGLDADSPTADRPCFKAAHTVTFASRKTCHIAQPAANYCGEVHLVDIGVEPGDSQIQLIEESDIALRWPWPTASSDKYSRGVVGIDTGSARYVGAALLGCLGAVYSGAGLVRYAGSADHDFILGQLPSATIGAGRVQTWLVGSGWGGSDSERFNNRAADEVPMVVDADSIALLANDDVKLPEGSLITPHAGELANLLDVDRSRVVAKPLVYAREAAETYHATVLLKGATNYSVAPDGSVLIAIPGPFWTAQGGSGDTLAGVCATLLAGGVSAHWAGAMAASLQALTAAANPGPFPPDVIARQFPATLAQLEQLA